MTTLTFRSLYIEYLRCLAAGVSARSFMSRSAAGDRDGTQHVPFLFAEKLDCLHADQNERARGDRRRGQSEHVI